VLVHVLGGHRDGRLQAIVLRLKLLYSNEQYAELGAYGVFAGLLVEVVLSLIFRTHKSPWEEWGPLGADILIAGGVWIEIHFGRKASEESAERVSAANERAAAAELATEKLRAQYAWRRLSPEAVKLLSDSLRESWESIGEYRYRQLMITYFGGDPETSSFAHEIGSIFTQSSWTVRFVSALYTGGIVYGLLVPTHAHSDNTMVHIARKALFNAGVEFKENNPPRPYMNTSEGGPPMPNLAVQIYVGPKPMPEVE